MKNKLSLLLLVLCAFVCMNVEAQFASAPAFPGAEGHGRYTTGGRGGTVVHVTNLNDSGTGSFREAVTGGSNRTIVFDVAGVIALLSDIKMKDNLTILGQTAPEPGITIRYYTVQPGANNIVRFIRFRRGQERDINDGADATWQRNVTGLILDHCSFSWSIDEIASFYDNNNFTMQWCTVGESLTNPGHSKGAHGYGGIWGGKLASFHHNMIAHVMNRGPRFNGARYLWNGYTSNKEYSTYNWENTVQAENVDFRNCVMYNAQGTCYGGPGGGQINIVNNYFKAGPSYGLKSDKDANGNSISVNSSSSVRGNQERITTISVANSDNSTNSEVYTMTSRYYINGNTVQKYAANNSGAKTANRDWDGVSYDSGVKTSNGERYTPDPNNYYGSGVEHTTIDGVSCVKIKMTSPCPVGYVTTHTADDAFTKVLTYAGASLYRDNVDTRYATEAQNGTATYTGSVTKSPGIIDKVSDVNGYTEENFGTGSHSANFDTDNDGMPDEWETDNGLNPNVNDANLYTIDNVSNGGKGYYTNIEVYANSLVEDIMKNENKDAQSSVDEYYPSLTNTEGGDTPTATPSEWFADSNTSVAASQTYTNDANITVTTSDAGTLNNDSQTIDGKSVTQGINVRSSTSGSTELSITPKVDGELKIYIRRQWSNGMAVNDGKDVNLYNGSTKETGVLAYNDITTTSDYAYSIKTYSLTANTTYKLTASGTTGRLYGYIFTPSGSSTPEKTKYTVSFENEGVAYGESLSIEEGQTVSAPTAPEKDGYTFKGWSLTQNGDVVQFPYTITAATTFYAVWEENTIDPVEPTGEAVVSLVGGFGNEYSKTVDGVNVSVSRTSGNVAWGDNSRGYRWQQNGVIKISVPDGYHPTSVTFTSGSNGNNVDRMGGKVCVYTDNIQLQKWNGISAKAESYYWANTVGQFNPISFENLSTGDIYVSSITVTYAKDEESLSLTEDIDYTTFFAGHYNSVILTRSIPVKSWSTLVVPFDVTTDQLEETFKDPANSEVAVITKFDGNTLYFKTQDHINANEPVLIYLSEKNDDNVYDFGNVTVKNGTPESTSGGATMVGTYKTIQGTSLEKTKYYFISGGKFYDTSYLSSMKPFRAYFYIANSSDAKQLNLGFGDYVTGVESNSIQIVDTEKPLYNMAGQRVKAGTKGLLIQNGKKIFIK